MKKHLLAAISLMVAAAFAGPALADGELHIYNWGDYTNPDLVKKFEDTYKVKITIDDYDSNETMLSKVRAGATGYDIVVPSDYTVKIMIDEGLLEKTEPNTMSNYKNIRPDAANVYWDDGRHYTVPWQFGTTSFAVDTAKYKGDIDTFAILFNPPDELKGQINMLEDVNSVMHAAERYLNIPRCGGDKVNLKKLNDLLQSAKPSWKTFDYNAGTKLQEHDVIVSQIWNGDAYRSRVKVPTIKYAYPREGIEGWMDNVAVLKGAKNIENAKLFQNFLMDPQNAALISDYAGYDNGIKDSHQYAKNKDWASSPELNEPAGGPVPEFVPPCEPKVVEVYNKIWTNLRK